MKPVKSADKNWNMCEGMQTGYHARMHFCMKMKMRDKKMAICYLYKNGTCQVLQRKVSKIATVIDSRRGYECDLKKGLCGWYPIQEEK